MFLFVSLQGCEPLRKKFTRYKKGENEVQQYEPILDPVDYPEKAYDPRADYAYRFSLVRVWQKELVAGLEDQTSAKRLIYFTQNIIAQLQEMDKLVSDDKRTDLQKAIQGFSGILETLDEPEQFYNLRDLKIEVEQLAKPILLNYTPAMIEANLKR